MGTSFRTQWPNDGELYFSQNREAPVEDDKRYLVIPFIISLLSAGALLARVTKHYASKSRQQNEEEDVDAVETRPKGIVAKNGGVVVFLFMLARIFGSAALVGLSVPVVLDSVFKLMGTSRDWYDSVDLQSSASVLLANAYALALAIVAIAVPQWRDWLIRHNIAILLPELVVYSVRDVWPLATYNKQPLDRDEGWVVWAKIGVLFFTSIVIPVFIPNLYKPVDPKNPSEKAHPEQVASWWSFHTYGYLTPLILAANRTEHLSEAELPPIADYDKASVLANGSYPYLNPMKVRKGRHIFWGIAQYFSYELFKSILAITIYACTIFAGPLAVNRLLNVLESGGESTTIRPWIWIVCMFMAPLVGSVGFQFYVVVTTRAAVNMESIVTQLIFDYSLKVRLKAEASQEAAGKASPDTPAETGGEQTKTARKPKTASSFIGRLNNLVTIDLNNITAARNCLLLAWLVPFQVIASSIFLYILLGWSAFVGLAVMVALLPVPGYLTSVLQGVQGEKMKKTDSRTQTVTESMNVIRMVKMFGWESKVKSRIDQARAEEMKYIKKGKLLNLFISAVTFIIPTITMLATYTTASIFMKLKLNASIVFSSMILFDSMRDSLHQANYYIGEFVKGRVSLNRLNDFFTETELLDGFEEADLTLSIPHHQGLDEGVIGFKNATFTWSPESSPTGASTPSSSSQFRLSVPGDLQFKKGKINLIIGPTGSGKTSILMALLGEMHFLPTHPDSAFNLPRAGGVSFSVQESWVQNETIRDNILFNTPYDEQRYKKVLHQCALEQDLELFEAGDLTEVGERGLTLSGGQKARLTLARAIYSKAEIVLLDDVLAALDVHTAAWIVNKCFKGDLVEGRTILLVTHNIALASPVADFIVSVSADGVATSRGNDIKAVLASEPSLKEEFKHDQEALKSEETIIDAPATDGDKAKKAQGKLILAEEVKHGNIGWKALSMFFNALGGDHVVAFFTLWIFGSVFEYSMHSFNLWFLGQWSTQYETHPVEDVNVVRYLGTYVGLTSILVAAYMARDLWWMFGTVRASIKIHSLLAESILGTTLRWLDETPISRIITRMTNDIDSVDGGLMQWTEGVQNLALIMVVDLISAVLFVPLFTLPGLFIAILGTWVGSLYLKAQLSVKREMSNAKSPMVAHFQAAMSGLVSLRAYGAEGAFREELRKRTDHYCKVARMTYDLNRWINFRIDVFGAVFIGSLAAYLTYGSNISAANIGFSLNRAVEFTNVILYCVRVFNMFQVEANSLERIAGYVDIEQEPKPTEKGKPPAAWPTTGELRAEKLSARYSKTGPEVLHDLTFEVRAGERVGVVGRTGSGKSSLTLSLLRLIVTEGKVYFDGLPTSEINLDALRSNITIIPQMPELLSGTLRYNLDPFDEYDDATLNASLRSSGLYAAHSDSAEGRLGLESNIASGGSNVSVGQRQIIALARAIVRASKLLILDEATSAIDHETDNIIQNTLRRELGSDVTVITIAHRLQTIIDADRIMVLDAGRIAEFASPAELLAKPEGLFKALCDESGDKAHLYEVANRVKASSVSSSSTITP